MSRCKSFLCVLWSPIKNIESFWGFILLLPYDMLHILLKDDISDVAVIFDDDIPLSYAEYFTLQLLMTYPISVKWKRLSCANLVTIDLLHPLWLKCLLYIVVGILAMSLWHLNIHLPCFTVLLFVIFYEGSFRSDKYMPKADLRWLIHSKLLNTKSFQCTLSTSCWMIFYNNSSPQLGLDP